MSEIASGPDSAPFSHCHRCGAAYPKGAPFPKSCGACGHTHYKNPLPVAVGLVPCEEGLLGVIRGIPPKVGEIALPGGYQDMETPEQACSRELREETGVELSPSVWSYLGSFMTPSGQSLMFFEARVDPIERPSMPSPIPEGFESQGFQIIKPGDPLAFPAHEQAVRQWFERRAGMEPRAKKLKG